MCQDLEDISVNDEPYIKAIIKIIIEAIVLYTEECKRAGSQNGKARREHTAFAPPRAPPMTRLCRRASRSFFIVSE
jgi:hypothetical protein